MAILFPDEQTGVAAPPNPLNQVNISTGGTTPTAMGMIGNVLDVNTDKQILINDGTNDRILIGYQLGGF